MTSIVSSITRTGSYEPFDLQVARGQITMHSTVNIYGYQPSVGTTFIPVWEVAGQYTYPVSAITMYIAGTAGDTASITISGLDANYNAISETVVMDGATPVATTKQYLRINGMFVSAGSATNPAGVVTLKDVTATTTYARINAGVGRTQAAIYTVPAGFTYYLQRVNIYTSLNGNDYATYQNKTISSTGVVQLTQQAPFPTSYEARRIMPRPISEKTDIQLMCKVQSGTGAVAISQEGYLIKNSGT
jgi:hypothetical protein